MSRFATTPMAGRTGRMLGDSRFAANDEPDAVAFRVDGRRYSLAQMLADKGDDPEFCTWACSARPGDVFADGEGCECIADDGCAARAREAAAVGDRLAFDRQFAQSDAYSMLRGV